MREIPCGKPGSAFAVHALDGDGDLCFCGAIIIEPGAPGYEEALALLSLGVPEGAMVCRGGCGAWVTGLLPEGTGGWWTCAVCEQMKREAVATSRGEGKR